MDIELLLGKTIIKIERNTVQNSDELIFTLDNQDMYKMSHDQDCCEHVCIDDIDGDLNDLLNSPVTLAEEATDNRLTFDKEPSESFTWTFYRIATQKGYVIIKWWGESNGYYSETANFKKITDDE